MTIADCAAVLRASVLPALDHGEAHNQLVVTLGVLEYLAAETPGAPCSRCGRPRRRWPLRRPNTCSPPTWVWCIRL